MHAELNSQNVQVHNWDWPGGTILIYNPRFESVYGCAVQALHCASKVHTNLLQHIDNASIRDLAREISRSSVYRVEKQCTLINSKAETTEKTKRIHGKKCIERLITFNYRIQEVEKALDNEGTSKNAVVLTGNLQSYLERSQERVFKIWVDYTRQAELQCIGSLIEILVDEVPALVTYKSLYSDLSAHLADGWPVQVEFSPEKHVTVTVSLKPLKTLSEADCPDSLFEIPHNYKYQSECTLQQSMRKQGRPIKLITNFLGLTQQEAPI